MKQKALPAGTAWALGGGVRKLNVGSLSMCLWTTDLIHPKMIMTERMGLVNVLTLRCMRSKEFFPNNLICSKNVL